jgi:hypothetical protein
MRISIVILVCVALAIPSVAASHYVWCGASGAATGADFTNAYTDLPASLTRNDTYYVAGSASCAYGYHTFNDAESSTNLISITKVTSAQSGIAGYSSAMATNPAKWNTATAHGGGCGVSVWIIEQGYYTFEGVYGIVGTTEPTTGSFGFDVAYPGDCVSGIFIDGGANSKVINNITINHTEIDGGPINIGNVSSGSYGLLALPKSGLASVSGFAMSNVYEHDWEVTFLQLHSPTNITVDHSWFARIMFTGGAHGNGVAINPAVSEVASNLTFSNDTWEDACGTSVITFMNGTIGTVAIYGNTFFQSTNTTIFPGGTTPVFCNADGTIGDLGPGNAVTTGVNIYNNTFYNNSTVGRGGVFFFNTLSTNIVQTNNLFFNTQYIYLTTGESGDSESYNTVINQFVAGSFSCPGTGDSCQGTSIGISTSSISSGVADVVTASPHGLSLGSPVLVMGSQVNSTTPCGIDTYYPYPVVSHVTSSTEFTYTVQSAAPNATCQAGFGVLFPSPVAQPFVAPASQKFTLISETVDPHLNDGTTLSSPYNIDPLGLLRGQDGTWERGAYEFDANTFGCQTSGMTAKGVTMQ